MVEDVPFVTVDIEAIINISSYTTVRIVRVEMPSRNQDRHGGGSNISMVNSHRYRNHSRRNNSQRKPLEISGTGAEKVDIIPTLTISKTYQLVDSTKRQRHKESRAAVRVQIAWLSKQIRSMCVYSTGMVLLFC
jgi:hypothetical protein